MSNRSRAVVGLYVLCALTCVPLACLGAGYTVHVVEPAITNHPVVPDGPLPAVCVETDAIELNACRDEYEPASFVISTDEALEAVRIEVDAVTGPGLPWPKEAVDVRVVKPFYRAPFAGQTPRMSIPTLLVHDDGFLDIVPDPVEGDPHHMKNVVRGQLRDAAELQPVDIERRRQFWITVHVPLYARPGQYHTTVRIAPRDRQAKQLALRINVYPFRLLPPTLEYSVYYPVQMLLPGEESTGFHQITAKQYRLEMQNMMAHGLTNPNIYWSLDVDKDGKISFDRLEQTLAARESVGMRPKALYLVSHPLRFTNRPLTAQERDDTRRQVRQIIAWAMQRGYERVFFMAADEWWGEQLSAERDSMAAVDEAGGEVFVAVMRPSFFDRVGDVLHRPILMATGVVIEDHAAVPFVEKHGRDESVRHLAQLARADSISRMSADPGYRKAIDGVHRLGNKIFTYMNPMGGAPLPDLHRRNEGLGLWRVGFDGTMNWAYVHYQTGPIDLLRQDQTWALVFRTDDGVLDTLHWEGYREGVDDVRYLTTLMDALNQTAGRFGDDPLINQTHQWIGQIDVDRGDLNAIRREMAERTMALLDLGFREVSSEEVLEGVDVSRIKFVMFPEPWRFKIDPADEGVAQKWFSRTVDDSQWAAIRTDQKCGWDKQGFAAQAVGYGWYRAALPLSDEDRRRPFKYLYFEAVDEDSWVYLNGRELFEHTVWTTDLPPSDIWLEPFMVPLDKEKLTGDDLLAVRVYNRAAMGGIWKPLHVVLSDQPLTRAHINAVLKLRQESNTK